MKRIVEIEGDGLQSLLGEKVLIMCMNYFYTGVLSGVNEDSIALNEAQIVYETGPFSNKKFKDSQNLPADEWFVRIETIESFGKLK